MIKYISGNIFDSTAPLFVNTVNCIGAMGVGLALACRKKWPAMYQDYRRACARGQVRPGKLHVWTNLTNSLTVINFPTKDDWRLKSRLSYIESGLVALRELLETYARPHIAIPALGCRNGGLNWEEVRELIERHLGALDANIEVYLPARPRPDSERSIASTPASDDTCSSNLNSAGGTSMFLPVNEPSQVTSDLTNRIVAATGHRPNKLCSAGESPYSTRAQERLQLFVRAWLEALRPMGCVTGMALGLDTAVALASRDLGIPYLCAIPFAGQERRWPESSRRLYNELLKSAAKVVIVSPGEYSAAKMQVRNEFMVDTALNHRSGTGLLFALWNLSAGGTANCVDYARSVKLPIINAWPNFAKLLAA